MNADQSVAVIGLGMIGGSVARGLAARGIDVVGFDTNRAYLDAAVAEGVMSRRLRADFADLDSADSVVVAVYGDGAIEILKRLERHADKLRLVTDVGSTKRNIVSAAEASSLANCFVGAHPFAGDHRSGWPASRYDLFENELVYLCPTSTVTPAALATAHALWTALGSKPVRIDASEHDDLLAWTSHLPHVISCALGLALAEAGIPKRQLGRGGRDVARLAAGSPSVWSAILLDNAESVNASLAGAEQELAEIRNLLSKGNREGLRRKLERARDWSGPSDH